MNLCLGGTATVRNLCGFRGGKIIHSSCGGPSVEGFGISERTEEN
jgi:hypothetical protein